MLNVFASGPAANTTTLDLVENWFSIIDDLQALATDPLTLEVELESIPSDSQSMPIVGWHIENIDDFLNFDSSTMVAVKPFCSISSRGS